jgi:hypothetical protein
MATSVLEMAAEGKASELREDLRRRALSSLYYFSKVLCSYDKIVPHFHMPLCLDIQNTIDIRKRGYLWPRKHFKSTIIAKSYPHWRLCGGGLQDKMPEIMELETEELLKFYKTFPDKDPRNLRIGIVGETGDVAEKDLKDIKDRTVTNELFRWLFPEIIPENTGAIKWTESEIVLPRSKSWDESTISCMGVGAKRTGFHYDILIYDDIIGEAASHSDTIMKDALDWLKAAPGLLNDDVTGEELFAGTRWKHGEADVYGWLMANMPFTPGVGGEPSTGFKWSTQSCYVEPTKEIRFKERFNTTIMEEIRKRAGEYLFNCNYRNTPTSPEGSKLAGYKYYDVVQDGDGKPTIARFEDGSPDVHINQLARVSFLDPSSGGKSAKCENAIAIVGTDELNRHLLLAVWNSNTSYSGAVEAWHQLNDRYVCWWNGYEQVGGQKEIAEITSMRGIYKGKCPHCQAKNHRILAPQGVKPVQGLDKFQRIEMFLEPSIKDGRFYVRRNQTEAIRQMDMFPHGDLVDIADAIAYAVKNSRPYRGMEEEMDARDEQKAKAAVGAGYSKTKVNYGGYGH